MPQNTQIVLRPSLGANPQVSSGSSQKKKMSAKNSMVDIIMQPKEKMAQIITPKKKKNGNMKLSREEMLERYFYALQYPFSRMALDARVPDLFSYPTATYRIEGVIQLNSNSSGNCSILFSPNPLLSAIDMTGTSISGTNLGMYQYATSSSFFAGAKESNLIASLANYRVVGAGLEVRNLLAPTAATGRVIVAHVPSTGLYPGPNTLDASALNNEDVATLLTGLDPGSTTTGYSTDILELPESCEFTLQDIIANAISTEFRPFAPSAFEFHNSSAVAALTSTQEEVAGDPVVTATGVVTINHDNFSNENFGGWDCIILNIFGAPASTSAVAEVKYVIHLEGTPALPSGKGTLAPSAKSDKIVDPIGMNAVLAKVHSGPRTSLVSKLVDKSLSIAQNYFKGKSLIQSILTETGDRKSVV